MQNKETLRRTIDSIVFLASLGEDFQTPPEFDKPPEDYWQRLLWRCKRLFGDHQPVNPHDYFTCTDSGREYSLSSGNVVLDYVRTVVHHTHPSEEIMNQTRQIAVLMPEDSEEHTLLHVQDYSIPLHSTATVLFYAERSMSDPKFPHDPPKERWQVGHVEDRLFGGRPFGEQWYKELLHQAEVESRRAVSQIKVCK